MRAFTRVVEEMEIGEVYTVEVAVGSLPLVVKRMVAVGERAVRARLTVPVMTWSSSEKTGFSWTGRP